jgi:hemerythrin-like metal-binding protein
MLTSSVPYGSHQLPVEHEGFTLHWVKQLAIQSDELNAEHEAVLQKLNGLLHAMNSGNPTHIALACGALSAEARVHFAKEEELMLAADYPDRTVHIEQHDELMRRLARIRYAMTSEVGFWSPASDLSMLERWFVPHISYADRRFADFIAARTVM